MEERRRAMTYIFTRHSEKPHPQVITERKAQWMVDRDCLSVRYADSLLEQLTEGKIDHIDVRDGRITVEKGKDATVE
jgi:hypothetical protein